MPVQDSLQLLLLAPHTGRQTSTVLKPVAVAAAAVAVAIAVAAASASALFAQARGGGRVEWRGCLEVQGQVRSGGREVEAAGNGLVGVSVSRLRRGVERRNGDGEEGRRRKEKGMKDSLTAMLAVT